MNNFYCYIILLIGLGVFVFRDEKTASAQPVTTIPAPVPGNISGKALNKDLHPESKHDNSSIFFNYLHPSTSNSFYTLYPPVKDTPVNNLKENYLLVNNQPYLLKDSTR